MVSPKLTDIDRHTLSEQHKLKRSKIQFRIVKKICRLLEHPIKNIVPHITSFGGVTNPKLPFDLSKPEVGTITAAFLSDGHIEKKLKSARYCASEKELHMSLIAACKKVFGQLNTEIKEGNKTLETRFPPLVAWVMAKVGVPIGCKQNVNCKIPKIILDGSYNTKKNYLQRIFDDEGDVCYSKNGGKRAVRLTRSISISTIKDIFLQKDVSLPEGKWVRRGIIKKMRHKLLRDELKLLKNFGIQAKVYCEGTRKNKNNITAKWRIQIGNRKNIKKFYEQINFSLKCKRRKLKKAIDSYKIYCLPNGEIYGVCVSIIKEIIKSKNNDIFKYNELMYKLNKKTGLYYGSLSQIPAKLIEKGKVRKVKRGYYKFIGE